MALLMTTMLGQWLATGEYTQTAARRLAWIFKPVLSALFVVAVVRYEPLRSSYGRLVLAALLLSWLGDVLLIPDGARAFRAGIAAFALGHVAYVGAFGVRDVDLARLGLAVAPVLLALFVAARWLRPHVPADMKVPVSAYMGIISAMGVAAAGASRADPLILVGALLFYVSDLSVARDRFVAPSPWNRRWGLPLYYAAQLILATSVGEAGGAPP